MGIPAHPLMVHAAVVFVPLLAIVATLYAFIPFVRPHSRWVLALLAVVTPVSALLAKVSGDAFFARLEARDRISEAYYPRLETHQQLGTLTLYASIVLAILALALAYFVVPRSTGSRAVPQGRGTTVLSLALGVLTVLAAAASLYYVIRTGDSGAKAVWEGS